MNNSTPSILETFRYLWPCVWSKNTIGGKLHLIFALTLIFVSIAINLSVPFFLKEVVTTLSGDRSFLDIAPLILIIIYAVIWGLSRLMVTISQMVAFPIEVEGARRFCFQLFEHLHKLSAKFHKDRKTGEILTVVDRAHNSAIDLIGRPFIMLMPVIIEISFAILILSYFYGVRFGLVLFLLLLGYGILSYYTSKWIVTCRNKQNERDADANTFIVDSLLHAETVKLFNAEDYEFSTAFKKLQKKEVADNNRLMAGSKIHLIQNAIIGACIIALTYMAGLEVIHGRMSVGDFVLVNGYLIMFMLPLSVLGYHIRLSRDDLTRFKTAIDILKRPIDIVEKHDAKALTLTRGDVVFKNVSFGYDDTRLILNDISFTVAAGTTTAIVGKSGSGKSTISRLLYRLDDLNAGEILIDSQNIQDLTKASLRNALGIVPQVTTLFNDSLRENLIYGNRHCSTEDLDAAIRTANLEQFISKLSDGLNTRVGERGLKLSGGEKQRVSIARMLIKKPKILIFDEATSALDMKMEKEIQDCLKNISAGVTTIIIAHRLSTIKHADNIIVLDEGEIVERGGYEQLLALNGYFAILWKKQHGVVL